MGYKEVLGGQTDPECTHVILTLKEYNQILQGKARAEQEARNTKYDAERDIEKAKREARYMAQKAAEEARQTVGEIKGALDAERAESAHQRALNANLLRVARERANADRKLKPKKQHSGYLVVFSGEREHQYKDGNAHLEQFLEQVEPFDFYREIFPETSQFSFVSILDIVGVFHTVIFRRLHRFFCGPFDGGNRNLFDAYL